MKSVLWKVVILLLVIGAFAAVYFACHIDSYLSGTLFFDCAMAVTAVFGVFGIVFQNYKSSQLDEAKFLVDLNKQYLTNDYIATANELERIAKEDAGFEQITDVEAKKLKKEVSNYLDFFDPIYIVISKKMVNISSIDALFSWRFFSVVNNKYVQRLIKDEEKYYGNIFRLYKIWIKRYSGKNKFIPFSGEKDDLEASYNKNAYIGLEQTEAYKDIISTRCPFCKAKKSKQSKEK